MDRIQIPWKTYRHYRSRLSQRDAVAYDAILNGLQDWQTTISLPVIPDVDRLYEIYIMVLMDVPALFHVSNAASFKIGASCTVRPEYIMTPGDYRKHFAKVEQFLQNCKKKVGSYPLFNQLQLIHDAVILHVRYHDTDTHNEHNVLGTIVDRKAVCESLAKSYKLICDYMTIPCAVVFGYSDEDNESVQNTTFSITDGRPEDNHAWNKVLLGGVWYNVDLTFDVTLGAFEDRIILRYDYFLRSDRFFSHHYPSQQRYLPDCNTDYQLYQRLDLTVRTEKDLQRILKDAKSKDVVFEVDPACGWTPSQIRDKVMQACFLLGKSPKSSNHNPVTNIYCVVFH